MKVTGEIETEVRSGKWRLGRKNKGYAGKNRGCARKNGGVLENREMNARGVGDVRSTCWV